MATTGIPNGTLMILYENDVAIGSTTSHSFSRSMETRDATTKSSAGNEEVLEGLRSAEVSFDGFLAFDGTKNYEEMVTLLDARTAATLKFSTEVAGDPRYSFTGYLTSLEMEAGVEDSVTYSGTFKITGAVTNAIVT